MRRRQWRRWFDNILDRPEVELFALKKWQKCRPLKRTLTDIAKGRRCVLSETDSDTFWSTKVLKLDCELEMTSISSICQNFDDFLEKTYKDCPRDRKRIRLARRCQQIMAHIKRIMTSVATLVAPDMFEINKQLNSKSIMELIDQSTKKDRIMNPLSKFVNL